MQSVVPSCPFCDQREAQVAASAENALVTRTKAAWCCHLEIRQQENDSSFFGGPLRWCFFWLSLLKSQKKVPRLREQKKTNSLTDKTLELQVFARPRRPRLAAPHAVALSHVNAGVVLLGPVGHGSRISTAGFSFCFHLPGQPIFGVTRVLTRTQ